MQTVKWQQYQAIYRGDNHTVVGALKIAQHVRSPQLNNRRDIIVYLPPSYEQSDAHYPVIYMQDGQNLFDQATHRRVDLSGGFV